jgi:hypothetical protein
VRENRVRGWRFIGFDAAPDDASALDLPLDEVGVVAEAVRSGIAASHEGGSASSALSFANLPAGREMIALPVSVGGQIVAVLYADQGPNVNVERASWPATLEVLTRHAARALESATAFRAAQMLTAHSHTTPSASVTGPTGARGDSTLLELGS